jgi:hypothetical protein
MAHARIVLAEASSRPNPSLLRLTLLALVLALGFDALSTALAWNVVRALPATVRRAPVHAIRPADARDLAPSSAVGISSDDAPSP